MNIKQLAAMAIMAGGTACANFQPVDAQTVEDFRVDTDYGYQIAGEISWTDQAQRRHPVVVLVSGSGPQDRHASFMEGRYSAHDQWVELFNAAGISVARFDETGNGESGGDWAEMGLIEHRDNVAAVIERVRSESAVDHDGVFVLGHSEGALIATMLSADDPDLAGLVLAAGAGRALDEILEYQLRTQAAEQAGSDDTDAQEAVYQEMRAQWMAHFDRVASLKEGLDYNPLEQARAIRSPALVIQGEGDWQVEAEQAYSLAAALEESGQPVALRVFDEVNHLLVRDPLALTDYEQLTNLSLDPRLTASVVAWITALNQNRHRS